jgi:hypothetical protein
MAHAHPDCHRDPSECRITVVDQTMTQIEWVAVHDGNGNVTNSDPNTFSTTKTCDTCGAMWIEHRNAASSTVDDVETAVAPAPPAGAQQ